MRASRRFCPEMPGDSALATAETVPRTIDRNSSCHAESRCSTIICLRDQNGNHDDPNQPAYAPFHMNNQRYYTFKPPSLVSPNRRRQRVSST